MESKTEKQHNPYDVRVRELFKALIPCAMDNGQNIITNIVAFTITIVDSGMVVAVVSFAKHLELIQTVVSDGSFFFFFCLVFQMCKLITVES